MKEALPDAVPPMKGISNCHHVYTGDDCSVWYRDLVCLCDPGTQCNCLPPQRWNASPSAPPIQHLSLPLPRTDHPSTSGLTTSEHHQKSEMCNSLSLADGKMLSVGDFVIVRVVPEGRKQVHPIYFVGSIISGQDDDAWTIKCMRRHRSLPTHFVFPDVDDIDTYKTSDILEVLLTPKIVRNIHHFSNDFSTFGSTLR